MPGLLDQQLSSSSSDSGSVVPVIDERCILEVSGHSEEHGGHNTAEVGFYMTFIFMMLFFFVMAAVQEKYHPPVGHETSFTLLAGIAFSIVYYLIEGGVNSEIYAFSERAFFYLLLPPIIFNSGYNMRRKKFFENLGNIAIFGICVTIVCFVLYSVVTWWMLRGEWLMMYNYTLLN